MHDSGEVSRSSPRRIPPTAWLSAACYGGLFLAQKEPAEADLASSCYAKAPRTVSRHSAHVTEAVVKTQGQGIPWWSSG